MTRPFADRLAREVRYDAGYDGAFFRRSTGLDRIYAFVCGAEPVTTTCDVGGGDPESGHHLVGRRSTRGAR